MKLTEQVRYVLETHPQTRNSDVGLTLRLWLTFHGEKIIDGAADGEKLVTLTAVFNLPSEAAIGRIRRKFNEQGLYLATDPVVIERRRKEKRVRRAAVGTVEGLGQALG